MVNRLIGMLPLEKYIWSCCNLDLWPQNLISPSLCPTAPKLEIWWNSHTWLVTYRANKMSVADHTWKQDRSCTVVGQPETESLHWPIPDRVIKSVSEGPWGAFKYCSWKRVPAGRCQHAHQKITWKNEVNWDMKTLYFNNKMIFDSETLTGMPSP